MRPLFSQKEEEELEKKKITIKRKAIFFLFLSYLHSLFLSYLHRKKNCVMIHELMECLIFFFVIENKMMARNINRYFYKEYFIEGFIKLLLTPKKLKDEINSEMLFDLFL